MSLVKNNKTKCNKTEKTHWPDKTHIFAAMIDVIYIHLERDILTYILLTLFIWKCRQFFMASFLADFPS